MEAKTLQASFVDEQGMAFDAARDEAQAAEWKRRGYQRAKGLTAKQMAFVEEYPVDFNATQAAIRAGYSAATAYAIGSELLKKVEIMQELAERQEERSVRLEITADLVQQEIAKLAMFDPRKFFHVDGRAKSPHELDDVSAAALAGLEVQQVYEGTGEDRRVSELRFKFKLADKGQNLQRLGNILGMFRGVTEGDVGDELAERMNRARVRSAVQPEALRA